MRSLLATLLVAFCMFTAYAQTGKHQPKEGKDVRPASEAGACIGMPEGLPCGPGMPPPPIADVTKEQHEQMKALDFEFRKTVLPLENKIGEAEAKLKSEATKDTPDIAQIDKYIDEISALKASIKKAEMRMHQSIRKILTAEQRLQFDLAPHHGPKDPIGHPAPQLPPPPPGK